ncbi:MAG: anti-sigma factor [Micavibrio sp.]|nr:anti-sigma factor [Micavibrio sp.]
MKSTYETLLMDYAAGTLDTAHNVIIASYLTFSPEARRYVAAYEDIGGAMMSHLCECAEMSNTCLEAVLAKLDSLPSECAEKAECVESCVKNCSPLPQPIAQSLPADHHPEWRRAFQNRPGGGMEWTTLKFPDGSGEVRVIRCTPGFALPRHTHLGPEITLVLDGSYEDDTGRYVRGDLTVMEDRSEHEPLADVKAGCLLICLNPHPIRFTGLFQRLFNPFI